MAIMRVKKIHEAWDSSWYIEMRTIIILSLEVWMKKFHFYSGKIQKLRIYDFPIYKFNI